MHNHPKISSVLAIDWGSKYVGVAMMPLDNKMIFPVGYLYNDQMIFFHLADLIGKHHVKTIVLGWPKRQENIQARIQKFMKNLDYIIEGQQISIETIEEDYSSVQAGEIVSDTFKKSQGFKKNPAEDTISAMIILERWKNVNFS